MRDCMCELAGAAPREERAERRQRQSGGDGAAVPSPAIPPPLRCDRRRVGLHARWKAAEGRECARAAGNMVWAPYGRFACGIAEIEWQRREGQVGSLPAGALLADETLVRPSSSLLLKRPPLPPTASRAAACNRPPVLSGALGAQGGRRRRRRGGELVAALDVGQGSPARSALAMGHPVRECSRDTEQQDPVAAAQTFVHRTVLYPGLRRMACMPAGSTAAPAASLNCRQARGLGKFLFFRLHGFGYEVLKQVGVWLAGWLPRWRHWAHAVEPTGWGNRRASAAVAAAAACSAALLVRKAHCALPCAALPSHRCSLE